MSRQRELVEDWLYDIALYPCDATEQRLKLAAYLDDLDVRLRRVESLINNSAPTAKAPL